MTERSAGLPSQKQVIELLDGEFARAGYEIEDVVIDTAARPPRITVVADGDDPLDLDSIAALSRSASDVLDRIDTLPYVLEVTSPGVDRPLTTQRHWRRARLRLVTVRPREGKPFTGRVGAAGEDAVTLLVDGSLRQVRYADVERAAVEVEFKPAAETEVALLAETTAEDPA